MSSTDDAIHRCGERGTRIDDAADRLAAVAVRARCGIGGVIPATGTAAKRRSIAPNDRNGRRTANCVGPAASWTRRGAGSRSEPSGRSDGCCPRSATSSDAHRPLPATAADIGPGRRHLDGDDADADRSRRAIPRCHDGSSDRILRDHGRTRSRGGGRPTADAGRADEGRDEVEARAVRARDGAIEHRWPRRRATSTTRSTSPSCSIPRRTSAGCHRARSRSDGSETDWTHGCPCRGSTTSTWCSWRTMPPGACRGRQREIGVGSGPSGHGRPAHAPSGMLSFDGLRRRMSRSTSARRPGRPPRHGATPRSAAASRRRSSAGDGRRRSTSSPSATAPRRYEPTFPYTSSASARRSSGHGRHRSCGSSVTRTW